MHMDQIVCDTAEHFVTTLAPNSVHLLAFDPPYGGIIKKKYDKRWKTDREYGEWLCKLLIAAQPALTPDASVVFFGAIGRHGHRPLFKAMELIEKFSTLTSRDMIAWKKRRAYGVDTSYLFCREEIVWYSASSKRKQIRFNIPLLDEERGYDGFNKKYKAKSKFKRVSNVWADIPELFKTEIECQKPVPLLERIVATHSHPGDTVVDLFCGSGTTKVAANNLGRKFYGCEQEASLVVSGNKRTK